MRLFKHTLLPLCVLLIAGCQQMIAHHVPTPMFNFMPVPAQLNEQGWLERFQFSGIVEESMLVSTEFTTSSIKVVALTFEGVPLTQLQFDTQTHELTSSNTLGVELDGKKIIYDMQSAFWPLAMLEQNMHVDNQVIELDKPTQRTRQFYRSNTLVREITYNGAFTLLTEYEQNYRLKIERLEEY
ncbi:DUF3261 domain-containing protein [Pseudoalteromonas sp. ZZD1]|uniref:DUF3261 domain-containing protein n=1 Tax=Pseudoalteromonas sp. ZZD1 TaxID=3139395 RepID=UPI003BAB4690